MNSAAGLDGVRYLADDWFEPIESSLAAVDRWFSLRSHGYGKQSHVGPEHPIKTVPSMFMPRWVSRLIPRITDVRVQRLQDISPDDCISEGAWRKEDRALGRGHEAVAAVADLWDSINGAGAWDANPWVWAYTFEVLRENVDVALKARG